MPFLNSGVILACLRSCGTHDSSNDSLKSSNKGQAISLLTSSNSLGDGSSGPTASSGLRSEIALMITSISRSVSEQVAVLSLKYLCRSSEVFEAADVVDGLVVITVAKYWLNLSSIFFSLYSK